MNWLIEIDGKEIKTKEKPHVIYDDWDRVNKIFDGDIKVMELSGNFNYWKIKELKQK